MQSHPPESARALPWSHASIASAVFSVTGFLTLWLGIGLFLAAAGAVFGHLARHATRGGAMRGYRLAAFGVGAGYGAMLLFPFVAAVLAASFPVWEVWRGREAEAKSMQSRAQVASLFAVCEDYARNNGNRYPEGWEALAGRYAPEHELRQLLRSPHAGGGEVAFELVSHDRPVLPAFADTVVVIQEIAPSRISQIAVVHADGSVRSIHNPAYDPP